jgi:hypothetical protein
MLLNFVKDTSKVESIIKNKKPENTSGFSKSVKLLTSTRYSRELEEVLKGDNKNYTFKSNNLKLLAVMAIESKKYVLKNKK